MDVNERKEERGLIFNIQKFSIHDGPGIRTTVFFKGCPLRCRWCANPESQAFTPQMMGEEADSRERTVAEVLAACLQDREFYEESGGGVTFSGGEPLTQGAFLSTLLIALREEGVSTAIETAAFIDGGVFSSLAPLADLLLFDIKHYDSAAHRRGTGEDNALILRNFDAAIGLADAGGPEVLPRIPVIPGFNASLEDAAGFAGLLRAHKAPRAQLLPFHQMGDRKYTLLGMPYAMHGVKPLYHEDLEEYRQVFLSHGVEAFF
jgi:pyruvate formate lyase activating enzyme